MRNVISASVILSMFSVAIASDAELPARVSGGIVVEEAWANVRPDGISEVFLVIGNRNAEGTPPLAVSVAGASATRIVSPGGELASMTIPPHSELYMQPNGIRIEAAGLGVETAVPVTVSLGDGGSVVIAVRVLAPGEAPPDHHDYDHG